MKIQIKKLSENAIIPSTGTEYSAGYDLSACIDQPIAIEAGKTVVIPTGIAIAIPNGYFGAIYARSGLATKRGLRPANCTGVIDADYRGEIKVALYNQSSEEQIINPGERIAQLIIEGYFKAEFEEVENLNDTTRGAGGFGSTGE